LVDDFARGGFRRCPACGGEMEFSGFHEWVKQQCKKSEQQRKKIDAMLEELKRRRQENSN
jgi:hypothetical protein